MIFFQFATIRRLFISRPFLIDHPVTSSTPMSQRIHPNHFIRSLPSSFHPFINSPHYFPPGISPLRNTPVFWPRINNRRIIPHIRIIRSTTGIRKRVIIEISVIFKCNSFSWPKKYFERNIGVFRATPRSEHSRLRASA